jgi:hypothetical protein
METIHLNGFNYTEFLKRRQFIGQVHPWNKNEQNNNPMMALLVPVQNAIDECNYWSGQDITREQFLTYMKNNNIYVFKNIDDFVKAREEYDKNRKRINPMSPRLEEILTQIDVSEDRVKYNSEQDRVVILGKTGYVYEDHTDPSRIHVHVEAKSKRHWSALKRKLSFMQLIVDSETGGHFSMVTGPLLMQGEPEAIRKATGLSKKHYLTEEYKNTLKSRLSSKHIETDLPFTQIAQKT